MQNNTILKNAPLSQRIRAFLSDYFLLTLGTFLYVIAWTVFMLPRGIVSGGLTGACAIIELGTKGFIPLDYSYFALNAVLLAIAYLVMGKVFGIRTIYCMLAAWAMFWFFKHFPHITESLTNYFKVEEKLLIPLIGGLLEAIGIGFIFSRNGSTGGTDIIALIMNKFWPISPGKVYLYTDLVIIASILFIPGKTFNDMLYGYLTMITFSFMVDYVLLGRKSTVQILVFSQHYDKIADYMMKNMNRGVTALNAVGWYTKKDQKVLLIIARKTQLHDLTKTIKALDEKAFVSVSPASSVYGEGFDQIKVGVDKKKKKQVVEPSVDKKEQ